MRLNIIQYPEQFVIPGWREFCDFTDGFWGNGGPKI